MLHCSYSQTGTRSWGRLQNTIAGGITSTGRRGVGEEKDFSSQLILML